MPRNFYPSQCMSSPSICATMREVLHTLGDIDFAAEVELENLQARTLDPKLKERIGSKIRAARHEKRQPFVEIVETLRQRQYRQSLAA